MELEAQLSRNIMIQMDSKATRPDKRGENAEKDEKETSSWSRGQEDLKEPGKQTARGQ